MNRIEKIEQALSDMQNGKMVIVVDDEDRENEGDFIIASEKANPEDLNFMMKYGRGLICISITESCGKRLELNAHLVTISKGSEKNLRNCLNDCINIDRTSGHEQIPVVFCL